MHLTTLMLLATLLPAQQENRQTVIVAVGAAGTTEYGEQFRQWADQWEETVQRADGEFIRIGGRGA